MELVIIGVYDDLAHARSAKNDLIASGFARGAVQLNPDHELSTTRGPSVQKASTFGASVDNFFRSLLSMDDKSTYSNVYAEAVRRGSYVLTVDVNSEEQRVLTEEIMRRFGPVDIDERTADWVRHGWRGHNPQKTEKTGKSDADALRTFTRKKEPGEPD
jgi:hypothetical protein